MSDCDSDVSPWTLDVDMGNSRMKWRLRCEDQLGTSGAMMYDKLSLGIPSDFAGKMVARIRIASVAGSALNEKVKQWCYRQWQVYPEYAVSTDSCSGVINGYLQPEKLGVDRWLAIVGAYSYTKRACLVVDCGSAITVDMVDNGGQHLGGYIVPGLQLMRRALFFDTDAVKVSQTTYTLLEAGRNTDDAVNRGGLLMVLGLIEKSRQQMLHVTGTEPTMLLTGGDAPHILKFLEWEAISLPDLVLDGLSVVMP